jgi:hypothetical protein
MKPEEHPNCEQVCLSMLYNTMYSAMHALHFYIFLLRIPSCLSCLLCHTFLACLRALLPLFPRLPTVISRLAYSYLTLSIDSALAFPLLSAA